MPTTSNFGWTTPADTDLVKDGAAAIRTLANGIDTSLVDLKGGTTGQILSKNSNTDLDYTWINNDQGDITAVTAGTGLTGGGTTGAVTLTNDMATTITAAGDIVVGTGSGTYDNLPIGTTGQILTADTTVSPYKVKWAAAASSGGITQLATGSLSGSAVNVTSISQDYRDLRIDVLDFYPSSLGRLTLKVNNNSGTIYLGESNLYYTGSNYSQTELQSGYTHNSDGNNFHTFYIYDYTNSMNKQGYHWFNLKDGGNSANRLFGLWQLAINITAINEINLGLTAGTFSGGTYYIYGVK